VTSRLVEDCKKMVEEEEAVGGAEIWARDYLNESNPSVLRYLIAAREEVSSTQLRDDLLSLLVAGHETTASVLTWVGLGATFHIICLARWCRNGILSSGKLRFANL
jgi:carotene epsilon-monooxygenase